MGKINFYIVQKTSDECYKTYSIFDQFSPVNYNNMNAATDLCRLRLNKTLISNNIKMFQIPFTNIWLAF